MFAKSEKRKLRLMRSSTWSVTTNRDGQARSLMAKGLVSNATILIALGINAPYMAKMAKYKRAISKERKLRRKRNSGGKKGDVWNTDDEGKNRCKCIGSWFSEVGAVFRPIRRYLEMRRMKFRRNRANFDEREVLISNRMLGRWDWMFNTRARPNKEGRSWIIDTGFNSVPCVILAG